MIDRTARYEMRDEIIKELKELNPDFGIKINIWGQINFWGIDTRCAGTIDKQYTNKSLITTPELEKKMDEMFDEAKANPLMVSVDAIFDMMERITAEEFSYGLEFIQEILSDGILLEAK